MSTGSFSTTYDVIVIGAGHAGCEASLAAARMGCSVLLLTGNIDTIARMSCNPAIGGCAKSHIVHELDALGGEMAVNIDKSALQVRTLNTKKGPAVQALRFQADKRRYHEEMQKVLEQQECLAIKQEMVTGLVVKSNRIEGVQSALGNEYHARAVVCAAGTFLNGVIHIGQQRMAAGRMGERASNELSNNLVELGFERGRLKTGTPPRVDGKTIDYGKFIRQEGDENPGHFSKRTENFTLQQVPCYIGYTTAATKRIIEENLHRSPLYGGEITGTGVRYCPSIEDKIVKFPKKNSHQIFLEPEGRETMEMYCNGLSTSLPYDVQVAFIRSIAGLEHAEIMRPGYAIEYDYFPPTQLYASLQTKQVEGLFFAGQINGTSGYEEAAAQGLMAGINAARSVMKEPPIILGRSEAYIGVMIDDLVTKGTDEPYRMFTSRAEFRLVLRPDNADLRVAHYGYQAGLLSRSEMEKVENKEKRILEAQEFIRSKRRQGRTIEEWLRQPGVSYRKMQDKAGIELPRYDDEVVIHIEIESRYAGYVQRQEEEIRRFQRMEKVRIPGNIDYQLIRGLKKEAAEKLQAVRPATLGQAARIPGVNPADISIIIVWLKSMSR